MTDIPFATQSYRHPSKPLSAQRLVNYYAEAQPKGAKSSVALLGSPGVVTAATLGNGPVRGFRVMNETLFAVSGAFLYQIDSDHTVTQLGGQISGSAPVSMSDNGTQTVVVNGVNGYIWSAAAGFRLISDTDFNAAKSVTFMDEFFLFDRDGTSKWFRSDLLDGTSYDSTAFATAESNSDNVVAVFNQNQIVYVLGTRSTELYSNTGAANFPFERIPGATIQRGLAAAAAIASEDEGLYILGNDRIAYRLSGRSLQRISTHAIEQAWEDYGSISDAFCCSYGWNGHKFVCFTFPSVAATWEYDIATGLWHERESHDRLGNSLGRWRANCAVSAYGRTYIGDAFTGKIAYLSNATYTEFGEDTRAEAVSPPLHGSGKRVFMPWFELDIETGVGLTAGQGENPQMMLSISDDGGWTFDTPELWASMGRRGETDGAAYQLRWDRLGNFFERCLKVTCSDPVRRTIYAARGPEMSIGL
jgi:hypothetical protein